MNKEQEIQSIIKLLAETDPEIIYFISLFPELKLLDSDWLDECEANGIVCEPMNGFYNHIFFSHNFRTIKYGGFDVGPKYLFEMGWNIFYPKSSNIICSVGKLQFKRLISECKKPEIKELLNFI